MAKTFVSKLDHMYGFGYNVPFCAHKEWDKKVAKKIGCSVETVRVWRKKKEQNICFTTRLNELYKSRQIQLPQANKRLWDCYVASKLGCSFQTVQMWRTHLQNYKRVKV